MGNCVRSLNVSIIKYNNMAGLGALRCFAPCPSGHLTGGGSLSFAQICLRQTSHIIRTLGVIGRCGLEEKQ